jgi:hypothetical protein
VEDKGIPRDQQLTDERFVAFREMGLAIEPHWNQDSAVWPGLQVADIAACAIRLAHKTKWKIRYVEENQMRWEDQGKHPFDRFAALFVEKDTFALLEAGRRTFRVMDLPLVEVEEP